MCKKTTLGINWPVSPLDSQRTRLYITEPPPTPIHHSSSQPGWRDEARREKSDGVINP